MSRLENMQQRIDRLLAQKDRVLLAIDGKCTAGKTTLASQLAQIYDCNVIHMDEFFLRPEQRTPGRYGEVGGNVDYERFREEVLLPLAKSTAFSYRPFDCGSFSFSEPVWVPVKELNIIEGTYSLHPWFGAAYDLTVLLEVTAEVQRQRILERPAFLHKKFFDEWIPMENRYFYEFDILRKADMVL